VFLLVFLSKILFFSFKRRRLRRRLEKSSFERASEKASSSKKGKLLLGQHAVAE